MPTSHESQPYDTHQVDRLLLDAGLNEVAAAVNIVHDTLRRGYQSGFELFVAHTVALRSMSRGVDGIDAGITPRATKSVDDSHAEFMTLHDKRIAEESLLVARHVLSVPGTVTYERANEPKPRPRRLITGLAVLPLAFGGDGCTKLVLYEDNYQIPANPDHLIHWDARLLLSSGTQE